jgi:class 3 adenylate cyclase
MRCVHCDADNPPSARFCGSCGAGLEANCTRCGTARVPGRRFCTGCGLDFEPAPAAPVASDDGERRHATVMFSDLSGYTALNEALDPEEVEAVLSRIKADATAIVERHGGTVNQFVGDEVMALFGVPRAHRDDARSAVGAALELHRAVDAFVATLPSAIARSLTLHTGINTGLVVTRRSDARAGDYAVTGDAVNTAARLRGLAEPGEVVVSATTWRQVSDFFEADASAPIAVKGKEQPLVAWRVRRERPAPKGDGVALIGRDEELREFRAVAEACGERRRSRVVVVRGDPGVGKSRIVAEFVATARTLGFACHGSAVLDFGAETGRDALRTLARGLIGVAAASDEATRRDAIRRAGEERALADERRLFLHDLLDVPPPAELRALAAAMSTAARQSGSLHALCDLAVHASAAAPLLLVVEDIHWADAWTLERLAALAAIAARHPLLLVMTTRFAGDPTAGAWRTALHGAPLLGIDLGPLSADASLRLAAQASSTTASSVVRDCVERAEGNPLFLLQLLLDAGEAQQASLPGSIQALVHTRMDRLAAADKFALQAAAVLGQRYTAEALGHLLEDPDYDGRVLVEHFLVRADGGEFLFCHALIRDGAYASLLHRRRRLLHARAAEWFAARDPVLAAEHFDRADDARAASAYLAASDATARQFHPQAALALVERGLALAAERDVRFALLMARGRLLGELGRSAEAIDASRAALDVAAGPGERAQALIAMAAGMRLNDRIDGGLAALAEAEPLATEAALELELSRLHHLRGNLLFPLGRDADCLRAHERARQHARAAGSLEAEAAALGGLGDGYYLQGRMRSAHQQFRDCVALARDQGYGRLEVANLSMVGWSGLHLGEIGAAVDIGHEAIALAVRASQPRAEMMARSLVRWAEALFRGRLDAADDQAVAAMALIRSLGARRFEAQDLGVSATIALRRGDRARARELAQAALDICRRHGMGHTGPWVIGVCAMVETDRGARLALLAEGEEQLSRGCVSHNHINLREIAIDALLEMGDWDGVVANCERIRAYTAAEPLPMPDFVIARGLALARFGRGDRSPALRGSLVALRDEGRRAELTTLLQGIEAALEQFGTAASASP